MVFRIDTLINTDLRYYVKHFKSYIDENLCDTLVNEIKTIEFKEHRFYDVHTGEEKPRSGSQELSMSNEDCPSRSILTDRMWYAIRDTLFSLICLGTLVGLDLHYQDLISMMKIKKWLYIVIISTLCLMVREKVSLY